MLFDHLRREWPSMGLYFDKDGPGAGGATDDGTEEEVGKEKEKPADSDAGDEKDKAKAKKDEKTFTQAELDQIVKDRLERERKKAEEATDKARKKAEADALEKNQEWQKLAEKRQVDLDEMTKQKTELESFKEQAKKYKAALDANLKKATEKLPKHILTLIEKMDPVDAMKYITDNAEVLGAKPDTYSETPEGKEKKVTDDDKKEGKKSSSTIVTRNF